MVVAGCAPVCFGFENEPPDLAANSYLLGDKGGNTNICGVYGSAYQLMGKNGKYLDP